MDFLDTFSEILSYSRLDEDASTILEINHSEQQSEHLSAVGTDQIDSGVGLSINLENHVVLEQFQDFYLLKNARSALFLIWAAAAETPIFKSTHWSTAYRAYGRPKTQDILIQRRIFNLLMLCMIGFTITKMILGLGSSCIAAIAP
jgi:hypothetical protein